MQLKKKQPKPILDVYNRRLTGIVKVNGEAVDLTQKDLFTYSFLNSCFYMDETDLFPREQMF